MAGRSTFVIFPHPWMTPLTYTPQQQGRWLLSSSRPEPCDPFALGGLCPRSYWVVQSRCCGFTDLFGEHTGVELLTVRLARD